MSPTSPISQGNKRLNFQSTTKLEEPKKFKGWVLGNYDQGLRLWGVQGTAGSNRVVLGVVKGVGWVMPSYSNKSIIGLLLRALYIHTMNITQLLLSGGST